MTPTLNITTNSGATDNVHLATTPGFVFQLHRQYFPDFSSGPYYYGNGPNQYGKIDDLNELLTSSTGTTLSGRRFSLVIWGATNHGDGNQKLFVNLPSSHDSRDHHAKNDNYGRADYSLPSEFRGVGFLIARVALRHTGVDGGSWTELGTYSLLGQPAGVRIAGASVNERDSEFNDSEFRIFSGGNATKEIAFNVGAVRQDVLRTISVPDRDITLGYRSMLEDDDGDTKIQVEKSADEDIIRFNVSGSEVMQINSLGNVGIGTASPDELMHIVSTDTDVKLHTANETDASTIKFIRNEGSVSSPTLVTEASKIGRLAFEAYDGNEFHEVASISAEVDGISGDNDLPTSLKFYTSADGGITTSSAMKIDEAGDVNAYYDLYVYDDLKVTDYISTGEDGYDGELRIFSEQGGTDYQYIIKPNATATENVTLALPPDNGEPGEALITDGSGGLSWGVSANAIVSTAINYTLTTSDRYIICVPGTVDTITLPTAVGASGKEYIIKNMAGANISIATTGGEELWQESTSKTAPATLGFTSPANWMKVISDGTHWISFQ